MHYKNFKTVKPLYSDDIMIYEGVTLSRENPQEID